MKRNILTLGAVMVAFGAFADSTWYTSDKNATYSDNYVIRKEYWKDGAEAPDAPWPVATRDYVLGGPREYNVGTGVTSAEGFGGQSLRVGYRNGETMQFVKMYFNGGTISCTGTGGLILTHGFFENWLDNGWMNVLGRVTVDAQADYPFYCMHAKATGIGGVRFENGSLNGGANADLLVTRRYNRNVDSIRTATTFRPMQAEVYSTLDGYYGTLEFDDGLTKVALGGRGVTAAGTTCPGTILIASTNTLDLAGSPSNTVSIANLTLGTDITLKVMTANVDGKDICSMLNVTDSLIQPAASPIKVMLSGPIPYVNPDVLPLRKFAFMKVKKSVKELSANDFVIDEASFAPTAGSCYLYDGATVGIDYDETSDEQTVYFQFARIRTLQTTSTGVSAFNKANITYWSDHVQGDDFDPQGIYYQKTAGNLQTAIAPEELLEDGGWAFKGRRLVVNNGMNVILGGNKAKYLRFDDLVMRATSRFLNWGVGNVGYWDFGSNEPYLNGLVWGVFKGKMTLAPYQGGWEMVKFISSGNWNTTTQTSTPRGYVLDMDIHSAARPLLAIGSNDSNILLTSYVALAGDNSDMKCPVIVEPHCNQEVWELGPQLLFWEGKNLGGPCTDNVGIWLNHGTTLWALGTTTIDATKRTMYIGHEDSRASVKVSPGKTLTLKNDLNVAGELRKRGEGNFVLGGVFHSCTGNLVKLDAPIRDSNRRVTVEEGLLEGTHVDCLRDALVSFKEGAALVARKPADDASADFRRYGIRGRCDGTWKLFDFASDGNLAYVPVKVVIDPQNHTDDYTFPLFTVGAAEAETLAVKAQRVNAAYEPARGLAVRIGKTANDDGSVTFTATVCTTGLAILFR